MKNLSLSKRFFSIFLAMAVLVVLLGAGKSTPVGGTQSCIVQGSNVEQVVRLVEKYGGEVTSRLDVIQGVGATLPVAAVTALQNEDGIAAVFPNAAVKLADVLGGGNNGIPSTDYPEVVGADLVWQEGNLGSDVTVAVVDTGIGWHPGLFLDANGQLNGRIVGWKDFVQNKLLPRDPNGHGTHIAGIIANSQTDADGEFGGIAPDVNLVGVRVLDHHGVGTYERVIQGIQWVINHKDQYNIRVMNLSIVSIAQSPYWADPLNQAVMQAWANGIVVVTAAGNGGPGPMTIGVPGNVPYVITVGAFTDNYTPLDWNDDYITPFSSAGPTLDGFVKPDVVAPGAHMVSTIMPGTKLTREYPDNKINPFYFQMAGTSQATAVVSGIAALILAEEPDLTPDEVKFRIMGTSFLWVDLETTDALYSIWQQGYGRVNAYDSVMFTEETLSANVGMDIQADLAGTTHYEGYTIYDETTGTFHLIGGYGAWSGGYGAWSGGYGAWSGGYGAWSGGYGAWSGGYGAWSGGYGAWSGGYGAWSGGYGAWSGGYGAWSGGYGAWSGGYGAWSGGYGAWSGSEPWAGSMLANIDFVEDFTAGVSPDTTSSSAAIEWVEEP
jgi:serine protease AprX